MKKKIIVDSCCDLTQEMRNEMGITSIPLTITMDNQEYCDDETLDIADFVDRVRRFRGKTGSASPAPFLYQQAIEDSEDAFVVTLSGKLSGSYNNAVLGNEDAMANGAQPAVIFDSKSAAAGETLIAVKLHDLIQAGTPKKLIVETMHRFINEMKTYLVLENFSNLQKNGRLNKVTGTLIQMMNVKLIMGADGHGEIALFEKCRGMKHMISQMLSLIERSGRKMQNENLVISHCNNPGLAEQLKSLVQARFDFKKIYIVPMGGLSSMYVDDKGLVLAF